MKNTTAITILSCLLTVFFINTVFWVNTLGNEVDAIQDNLIEIHEDMNEVREDIKDIRLMLDEYMTNQASATLKTQ